MSDIFFEACDISKAFHGVKALDNVTLQIGKGEVHCLIGENGSGKSTLIKIIGGSLKADAGSVSINGKDITSSKPIDCIKSGIQIIYQHLSIFPNLTVAENISINQMLENNQRIVNWKQVRETAQHALNQIGETIDLDTLVEDLPVAKRQIVAICRAVTQNARLIIMDEATSSLTNEEVSHLFSVILKLKKKGISTLFVSHKFSEVFEISENITVIRDGQHAGTYPISELDHDRLSFIMTGKELEYEHYTYQTDNDTSQPLLSVDNLSLAGQYKNISFELHKGEILGISGLIGSGRTEIVETLFGLRQPDSGTILIEGKEVEISTPQDAIKHGIALLPEDRMHQGLFEEKPISDNIVVTILDKLLNKFTLFDTHKISEASQNWIDRLKIKTPSGQHSANSLSGGNQQRVVLAKWLATNPSIFILDGPTIGVDIGSKTHIHNIIKQLAKEGMSIIIVSDEPQELLDCCNRLLLIRQGQLLKKSPDPINTSPEQLFQMVSEESRGY